MDGRSPVELKAGPFLGEARGDERLLQHVFTNLLSNAIKYSEPDQPVQFVIEQAGPDALCRVIDRGIGIPDSDQPWLFQAFHRGRNVGQRQGTGLGLVIAKRCVELHRGKIRVESRPNEGMTVIVTLPLFAQNRADK